MLTKEQVIIPTRKYFLRSKEENIEILEIQEEHLATWRHFLKVKNKAHLSRVPIRIAHPKSAFMNRGGERLKGNVRPIRNINSARIKLKRN